MSILGSGYARGYCIVDKHARGEWIRIWVYWVVDMHVDTAQCTVDKHVGSGYAYGYTG